MLRTSNELVRYEIKAIDGKIGQVTDLLFDDSTWKIRAIVVDTGGFLHHHKVLLDPVHIAELLFPEETFLLDLSRGEVKASPDLIHSPPVSQQQSGEQPVPGQIRDKHLRSCHEVSNYELVAGGEALCKLHGLIIETSTWTIRYVIADTGGWLTGHHVLIAVSAIQSIDWSAQAVKANVSADAIRQSPAYDETEELSREYEAFLHDHYGWPPYWD